MQINFHSSESLQQATFSKDREATDPPSSRVMTAAQGAGLIPNDLANEGRASTSSSLQQRTAVVLSPERDDLAARVAVTAQSAAIIPTDEDLSNSSLTAIPENLFADSPTETLTPRNFPTARSASVDLSTAAATEAITEDLTNSATTELEQQLQN